VHRSLGQQRQDRRADIAAPAATATAAATTRTAPVAGTRTARSEAELDAGPERTAAVRGRLRTGVVSGETAHFASGFAPGLVHGAAAVRIEGAEAEFLSGWARVRALEWFSHANLVSRSVRVRRMRIAIAQRYIGIYRDATLGGTRR
jgi:hypothetical protein